jgi:hypothetical protein
MLSAYIMNLGSKLWGKKWRTVIIWTLRDGPMRFSQIKLELPGCSVKMLSEALQDLENSDIIVRTQYNSIPVKVTYHLHVDTLPLIHAQVVYRAALAQYFISRQDYYDFPEEVIRELNEELLPPK